jgi:PAS domain S-box-containing protein
MNNQRGDSLEKIIRLLYIDDNVLDQELVLDALIKESSGFAITTASSQMQFEQRLANGNFDLVLSDFNILGFEGLRVLDIVKASGLNIPVILVTGTGSEEIAAEAIKRGAADYVLKSPSHIRRLPDIIRGVLEKRQLEDERNRATLERDRLFDLSTDLMCIAGYDLRFNQVNPAWEKTLGWTKAEIMPRSFSELIHADDLQTFRLQQGGLEGTKRVYSTEIRFQCKDGSYKWISWKVYDLKDESLFYAVGRDTTDRRQAEEELRQSEARYRDLFEEAPVSLWVEDFSEVKQALNDLRSQGVTDFKTYLEDHPEVINQCKTLIKVVDVNKATLALYKAGSKVELIRNLSKVFEIEQRNFMEELIHIAQGYTSFEWEGTNRTVNGESLTIHLGWLVVPGYEDSLSRVMVSVVDITERTRFEEKIRQQVERLAALRTVDTAITSSFDLRVVLGIVLDQLISQLKVHAADILLTEPDMMTLSFAEGRGFRSNSLSRTQVRFGDGLGGWAALERRPVMERDLAAPEMELSGRDGLMRDEGFASYIGLPLIVKGKVKGILEVFHRTALDPDPDWLGLLETLAGQTAIAIDNTSLFENLQRSNTELFYAYNENIEGWSRTLDLRDKETDGHTRRVTDLTLQLAGMLSVNDDSLAYVRWGALLHDIGKMGIPDAILFKPGPLDPDEWTTMRMHPILAYQILSPIAFLRNSLDIPYCHHEKWDGSGYPRALKGEQIPLAARIFAVVDVYDALTSDRPYRKAWSQEDALGHIRTQAGLHFDPAVVETFLTLIE